MKRREWEIFITGVAIGFIIGMIVLYFSMESILDALHSGE